MAEPYRFGGPIPTKARAVKAARKARHLCVQLARRRERMTAPSMAAASDLASTRMDLTVASSQGCALGTLAPAAITASARPSQLALSREVRGEEPK